MTDKQAKCSHQKTEWVANGGQLFRETGQVQGKYLCNDCGAWLDEDWKEASCSECQGERVVEIDGIEFPCNACCSFDEPAVSGPQYSTIEGGHDAKIDVDRAFRESVVMDNSRAFDLGPQNVATSSYTYVDGFDNAVLGTSDHAAIYHGEGNTILNSPWTQLYHSHHVIVEGGEKMTLHSLSYVHVTPAGHRPLNESDWDALTKRVRGIE
jgi:hypothetical protein